MESAGSVRAGPRVAAAGVEIPTYHLGGEGPPLMLLHATGFHGRCWIPFAPSLSSSYSVWAIDQRGHGSAGKVPGGRYDDWNILVDDLFAVLDALGESNWRGFGHSMGGTVLLLGESVAPGTFVDLCCYEPVVFPPGYWPAGGSTGSVPLADRARKRRHWFASRQEALDNYASKPPFNRFSGAALKAYVTYGLVDDPSGGVTLACRREDEASFYEGAPATQSWEALARVLPSTLVLGGGDDADPISQVVEQVANRLPNGRVERLPGLDHFGPFEDPGQVAEKVAGALGAGVGQSTKIVPPHS